VVVFVAVAVADEDHSGHGHDHGYDHDLLRLSWDYGHRQVLDFAGSEGNNSPLASDTLAWCSW